GPGIASPPHVTTSSATSTVSATVTDADGSTQLVTGSILVKAVELQGGDLVVGGTGGNDTISVIKGMTGIMVTINGVSQGTYKPTTRLVAYGQAGDDTIQGSAAITLTTELHGGAGNDSLFGGGGPTRLLGEAGN